MAAENHCTASQPSLRWFDLKGWCENPPPEPPWLLLQPNPGAGLWIEGHAGFIQGPPGAGKTWLACDLAIAIATGGRALGRFEVNEAGTSVLISEEGCPGSLYARLRKLMRGRGVEPDVLGAEMVVGLAAQGFHLDDDEHRRDLIANLESLFPRPKLVVFDSLYRIHCGNENSTADMSRFVAQIDEVKQHVQGAAIVVIHHSRKPGIEKNRETGPIMRGSTVLSGWADAIITVNTKRNAPNICEVSCEKQREGAPFETFTVERRIDGDRAMLLCRDGGLDEARIRQVMSNVSDALEHSGDGLNVSQLLDRVKVRRVDLITALNRLKEAGTANWEAGPRNAKIWKLA